MSDKNTKKSEVPLPQKMPYHKLEILSDNIPGGMFSCLFNEELTLLQMNRGFLSMLGYTRQEVAQLFQNSFWKMIDVRDRASAFADAERQLLKGPDKVLEYRMNCKDGRSIWVLDKGHLIRDEEGLEYFCCVLVDVTKNKENETNLRLSLERHQIIMNQTTDILFDWDMEADTLSFSGNWEKKFGCPPVTDHVSLFLRHAPHVFAADQERFFCLFLGIRDGVPYSEEELRFVDVGNHVLWCRVRISGLTDETGQVVRAVGVILDIDTEKRAAENLMERAQRDALTKLYNKGASQDCIEELLDSAGTGTKAALFIIDLDNFKYMNDTMGHLFGDALLSEVAHTIQKQFRSQDIVGRVGGDEFLVFLYEIPYFSIAEQKAARVMKALGEMVSRELANVELSCSIGIAVFPDAGQTYKELYQRADEALYRAKKQGKNRYCVFNPNLQAGVLLPDAYSATNTRIESDDEEMYVELRLIEYVFRILYKATDLDAAVNAILEVVGRQLDVSRVYIFEDDEDDRFCINTFEWCNEGVAPEIENLQHVPYASDLKGGYRSNFDENGVFYCRDVTQLTLQQREVLEPQGIKALLQCVIYDNGKYRGFVGFDECRTNRFWTQEQVNTIVFIAEIVSTFLMKMRAQDRAVQNAQSLETILDNQSSFIYVINPQTFEMCYVNGRTKERLPEAKVGITCHQAFYYRDTPCDFCLVKKLSAGCPRCVQRIYNPFLKLWVSADACFIDWKGEKAVLITCHDITDIKSLEKQE